MAILTFRQIISINRYILSIREKGTSLKSCGAIPISPGYNSTLWRFLSFQTQTRTRLIDSYEEIEHIDDGSFQEPSVDGEGDYDSSQVIAENLEPNYNYNSKGTNIIYTVALIINASLGAALLNFPKSFDDAGGVLVAILVSFVMLIFIMIAILALAYAADECGSVGAATVQVDKHDNQYLLSTCYTH